MSEIKQVQRWTGVVEASDLGGFVSAGDYFKLLKERDELEESATVLRAERDDLQAKLAALEKQEPIAWITPDGEGFRIRFSQPASEVALGWDALYAAAGAAPAIQHVFGGRVDPNYVSGPMEVAPKDSL